MKKFTPLIVIAIVIVLIGGWLMGSYNSFVNSDLNVETQWSAVETQYQRRVDLIPNLVASVQEATDFEQETFVQLAEARTQWAQAQQVGNREDSIAAARSVDSALSRLIVAVEAYPQLRATETIRDLMTQLEGTENRITTARLDYNTAVQEYNGNVRRFPSNILAGIFGFDEEPFFEAEEGSENAPDVQFDD